MRHLTRRGAAAVLGLSLALGGTSMALAADPLKVRLSTAAVPGDWHAEMMKVFEKQVEEAFPEAIDVEIHLNAALFKQGTEPAAMQRGNLDMGLISAQDIAKQVPAWSIFTAGYLIRDPEHQQKVFHSDIGEEMYGLVAEEMNIKILDVAYLGTRQLNLRDKREVKTPADLEGVKLRMPGSDTWQFLGRALGANPTPMAFGEVYLGLQTGAIDGQDNPLPTDEKAKFYEVTEQIVLTGHLVDAVFIAISNETWKKLTPEQQKVFQEAAAAAVKFNNEHRVADEKRLVEFFESKGLAITTPDVDAFRSAVQKAYLESEFSADWPKGMVERVNAVQ
ncbi:sialic acid TRAP transporter substrate-binding protein SiaP [Geminicoccaceae bacterium 1502E]|nr:sialic acid TRAP transporter substrate-binding protein SiaP [Geminicoccaceae bacterium 1502E]